ncbi:MAG: iron-containing alcohol dehydrogenase [Hyphomicrobiales bacterium]|nr:iron-containing alcohol dehydrogenase [Hyphomicrobiales bacterium]
MPRLVFGAGAADSLPAEVAALGRRVLVVTGARSFRDGPRWPALTAGLEAAGVAWHALAVPGEPSPELVDGAVRQFAGAGIEVVLGIGGGSALDAAKAVAGLLPHGNSVMDHLEGVGPELPYAGPSLPLVAAPTTAGTGSEATKNAVLSRHGPDGFKKSFRDEQLVARVAVVDPDLLASCPAGVVAANGMDAFTQLLESFTSRKANPMTDALAWSGLQAFARGFFPAWEGAGVEQAGEPLRTARSDLAYASLMSGICLAQVGLGSVHGLAQPLGSLFPIPHGVVCGTLVAEATAVNLAALAARAPDSPALPKYARVGELLGGDLVGVLRDWTARLDLPRLGAFQVTAADSGRIVARSRGSSMQTNPVALEDDEVAAIVAARL